MPQWPLLACHLLSWPIHRRLSRTSVALRHCIWVVPKVSSVSGVTSTTYLSTLGVPHTPKILMETLPLDRNSGPSTYALHSNQHDCGMSMELLPVSRLVNLFMSWNCSQPLLSRSQATFLALIFTNYFRVTSSTKWSRVPSRITLSHGSKITSRRSMDNLLRQELCQISIGRETFTSSL